MTFEPPVTPRRDVTTSSAGWRASPPYFGFYDYEISPNWLCGKIGMQ